MAKTAALSSVDLEAIDRLEQKLKQLVAVVERMKAEQARAADENHRLLEEIDALRARLTAGESATAELSTLRQEREVIRSRVSEMLDQLEALSL